MGSDHATQTKHLLHWAKTMRISEKGGKTGISGRERGAGKGRGRIKRMVSAFVDDFSAALHVITVIIVYLLPFTF